MHITFEDFIAGWIGGISSLLVGHPLDTIKVRQQAYGSSLYTAIRRTFKHEGILGFYKGALLPFLTIGQANALLFGVYGNTIRFLDPNHIKHEHSYGDREIMTNILLAGSIGGFFQTVFLCPIEVVKTVLQAKTDGKGSWRKHYEVEYPNSIAALKGIFKDRGIKGLYRGFSPMIFRDVPTSGIYVLTYEMLLYASFRNSEATPLVKQIISGGTAGVVSWVLVFPFDVVKARMQTDNPQKPKYRTMRECFQKLYKEGGYRVFFKGAPATVIRTFPVNSAMFVTYEMTLKALDPESK